MTYPDVGDPDFAAKLAVKKEFSNAAKRIVPREPPQSFQATRVQTVVRRFLAPGTPYNSLLLYHSLGQGKSCSAIQIAHQFARPDQRALVLAPRALTANFGKEVYDVNRPKEMQCVARPVALKRRLDAKRLVDAEYQVMGFFEFVNFMRSLMPDSQDAAVYRERVNKAFSGRVIIIDEVHNIRDDEVSEKLLPPLLRDMVSMAENIKLIVMSATPMFNRANEVVDIINLLRLADGRDAIEESTVFDPKTGDLINADALAAACRGYVSYVKGVDMSEFPTRVAPQLPAKTRCAQTVNPFIVCSQMTKTHEAACMAGKRLSGNMMILLQQSNIMFPGNTSLDSAMRRVNRTQFAYPDPKQPPFLSAQHGLGAIAPKLQTVVTALTEGDGISLVYSFFLEHGLIPLAIALEHAGFTRAFGTPMLANSSVKQQAARGSYVLLSSETRDLPAIIAAANDPANYRGERIRVILGTSVISEGIDLKCVRAVHVLEPWFHNNKIEQVIGRAVRRRSHVLLPPKERTVQIFLHAATFSKGDSPDMYLYRLAAEKQRVIDQVEIILRDNAVDKVLFSEDARRPQASDASTFSARHVVEMLPLYSHLIRCAFRVKPRATLTELREALSHSCLGDGSDAVDDVTLYHILTLLIDTRRVAVDLKGVYSLAAGG